MIPNSQHIVLFGGSFNPPHLGHTIVIAQAFELIPDVDELWLLPDYHHTFGKDKDYASPQHRLAMTKMLENHRVRTATYNIDAKTSGETIVSVRHFKKAYPQHRFSFLMGSDNLASFTKWGSWEKLLEEIPFYIYPRAGLLNQPLYKNMTLLESPHQAITNISSTLIRNRLEKHLPINHLVPSQIATYLSSHNLYTP